MMSVLAAAAGFVTMICVGVLLRLTGACGIGRAHLAGAVSGAILAAAVGGWWQGWDGAVSAVFLFLVSAWVFVFVYLVATSGLRTRTLLEIETHPEGLTIDAMIERYNARQLVAYRLDRLRDGSQVVLADGRLRLAGLPGVLGMALFIDLLRLIVCGCRRPRFHN